MRDNGIVNADASVLLVHGILNANGRRLKHAWIEIDDRVIDCSNNQGINVPAVEYYEANDALVEKRFSRSEADALLSTLPKVDGLPSIGYWGEISDSAVSQAIQTYQESFGAFASDISFSDPFDPANSSNLQIESFEFDRRIQRSSETQNPHQQLKQKLETIVNESLQTLLQQCHQSSLKWKGEVLELFLQEDEATNSARTALRIVCIKDATQVHIPTIAFPDSWRGKRLGMSLIRDLFVICETFSYSLFITHMVESFHRYMIGIGAHRTDFETVEILPTTRLV